MQHMGRLRGVIRLARIYPALLRFAWERAAAYRAVFVVTLMNAAFPLVMMAIWIELAREVPVGGFSAGDFAGYYLAAVLVRRITVVGIVSDLERLIHSGELSHHLLRPLHVGHVFFARALAGRSFIVALVALIVGAAAWVIPGTQFDLHARSLVPFVLACILGLLFEFFTQFGIAGFAFWIAQVHGISAAFQFIKAFFGGYIVPLELLPREWSQWLIWSPFPISVALPVEILTGRVDAGAALLRLVAGSLWVLLTALVARWIWQRGLRVYSAVGA